MQISSAIITLGGIPLIVKRNRTFASFYRAHLKTGSATYYTANDILSSPPSYDLYLAGSDQIWNPHNNGGDLNYLLDFVDDKARTVSYASSFGIETLPAELQEDYARALRSIRHLSVRESNGAALLKSITGRKAKVVLDPVFLLNPEHWKTLADDQKNVPMPYILLYTSKASYFQQFCHKTTFNPGQHNLVQVGSDVSLSDMLNRRISVQSGVGPKEFLGLINGAELVLTSSFHGTAISILLEKPFITFLSGDSGKDRRILGLLKTFGLTERIFNSNMTIENVNRDIDYKTVNQQVKALKEDSINFLKQALRECMVK